MNVKARAAAIEMCANVQRKGYQYYAQRGILRRTNRPIESLLGCTHQLADGYPEPCDGFVVEPGAVKSVFDRYKVFLCDIRNLSSRDTRSFFEGYTAVIQSWNLWKIKSSSGSRRAN